MSLNTFLGTIWVPRHDGSLWSVSDLSAGLTSVPSHHLCVLHLLWYYECFWYWSKAPTSLCLPFIIGHEGCSHRVYFSLYPHLPSMAGKSCTSTILLIFISMSMWCNVQLLLIANDLKQCLQALFLLSLLTLTQTGFYLCLAQIILVDKIIIMIILVDKILFPCSIIFYDGSIPHTVYNSCFGCDPQKEQHFKCIPCKSINSSNNNELWPNQITLNSQNAFAFILFWLKISLSCSK